MPHDSCLKLMVNSLIAGLTCRHVHCNVCVLSSIVLLSFIWRRKTWWQWKIYLVLLVLRILCTGDTVYSADTSKAYLKNVFTAMRHGRPVARSTLLFFVFYHDTVLEYGAHGSNIKTVLKIDITPHGHGVIHCSACSYLCNFRKQSPTVYYSYYTFQRARMDV